MKIRQTYICEPVRTAVGKFGGAYKQLDAQYLGATVVKALLERTELPVETVDDVLFAQCYSSMDAPALGRVVADWIKDGHPPMDLWEVDIRRQMPFQANRAYLQDRVSESLGLL